MVKEMIKAYKKTGRTKGVRSDKCCLS